MNANFRAEKCSGPSRYGRYGSYTTLVPWLRSGATALDPQNRAYITEPQRLRLRSDSIQSSQGIAARDALRNVWVHTVTVR